MSSTLKEIGDYLEGRITELTQGENLFLGRAPDSTDAIVVVYQYPGGDTEMVQERTVNVERSQAQVVARADDYDAADRLAALAWSALASVRNAELSGTKYRSIVASGRGSMGVDTNDRSLVGFNASIEKEVSLVS